MITCLTLFFSRLSLLIITHSYLHLGPNPGHSVSVELLVLLPQAQGSAELRGQTWLWLTRGLDNKAEERVPTGGAQR